MIESKKCPRCNIIKQSSEFYIRKNRHNELSGYCKVCTNQNTKERQRKAKINAVNYLGGKCFTCGIKSHPAIYDFHHKDPSQKDFEIGSKSLVNFNKLKPELDKCILLCANCHRLEHSNY